MEVQVCTGVIIFDVSLPSIAEALSLELRVGESGGVADLTEQLSILNTSGHETVLNDEGQVSTSNVMEGMMIHNHNHWSGGEGGGMNNE